MKRILRTSITLAIVLSLVTIAQPQAPAPETFASFWQTFKAAIARNDKEAVADLTKLPFLYDSRERDRAGFIKIYPQLVTPKVPRVIARVKPLKEQEGYDVFCGEIIFYFAKDANGKFKFDSFGPND